MIQKGLFVSLENKIKKKKNSEFFGFDILLIPVHKHKKQNEMIWICCQNSIYCDDMRIGLLLLFSESVQKR